MRFFRRQRRGCAAGSGRGQGRHRSCPGAQCGERKMLSLADLEENQCGVVRCSSAGGSLGQKLLNMGFVPGAEVCMIRNAPLRDPIEIGIQNYLITLRRTEAALIEVESV